MKLHIQLLLCVSASLWTLTTSFCNADDRPNVVIIYADDMGYGDLAIQNADSKIGTPHLDPRTCLRPPSASNTAEKAIVPDSQFGRSSFKVTNSA